VKLDQYQVNAFTTRQFGGNPAAVVPLDGWLSKEVMLAIAAENNLSETAFYVAEEGGYGLRWFTPTVEVDLCGHATLATAHVLFNELSSAEEILCFTTRSGQLQVSRIGEDICMDFPSHEVLEVEVDPAIAAALGVAPEAAYQAPCHVYRFDCESTVRALQPDMRALLQASELPVIVTSAGDNVDFVSRFFGPQVGVDEDPVTGSAHCSLTPLWAGRLGKDRMRALQVSARLGELDCELAGDRVKILGRARTFLRGRISVDV
jgi:PhzF family phenazine biosynthesis protein